MFVRLSRRQPHGSALPRPNLPQIQHVVRTNFCDLGFHSPPTANDCVIVSCLDNLLKGAAGQAVQNMNLMCGWNEAGRLAMRFVVKLGGAALETRDPPRAARKAIAELVARRPSGRPRSRRRRAAHPHPRSRWARIASSSPASASPTPKPATLLSWSSPAASTNPSSPRSARTASPQSASPAAMATSSALAKRAPTPTSASSAKSSPPIRAGSTPSGRWAQSPSSPSIALGFDGEYYNINADEMAAACAIAARPTPSSSSPTSPASTAPTATSCAGSPSTNPRAR